MLKFFCLLFLPLALVEAQEKNKLSSAFGLEGEMMFSRDMKDSLKQGTSYYRFSNFAEVNISEKAGLHTEAELENNDNELNLALRRLSAEYAFSGDYALEAGIIQPSIGLVSEYENSPLLSGIEHFSYYCLLSPFSYYGGGAAVSGQISGFEYRLAAISRFDEVFGGFSRSNMLYNLRVYWAGIDGLLAGASYSVYEKENLFEFHSAWTGACLLLAAEFALTDHGYLYYTDAGYDIAEYFGLEFSFIPYIKYSACRSAESDDLSAYNEVCAGLAVVPSNRIALRVDVWFNRGEAEEKNILSANLGFEL